VNDTSDDILTRPLGVPASAGRPPSLRPGRRAVAIGLGGIVLLGAAALSLLGDPGGGEPRAQAAITIREPAPAVARAEPAKSAPQGTVASGSGTLRSSAEQIEQASGVTVYRPAGASTPESPIIIRVPDAPQIRLAAAPDARLIERGRHGPVPRVGEGRLRALDVYARPDPGGTTPRIAIVVSGLGIGQAATVAAIARLPSAVSLALSPYGPDLEKTAFRIRDAGHELLLSVPMEPFDYPDSDPGPQTLLTSARPAENLDRLAWAMSRFPGFVGVVNMMGAKLTGDAAAFEPILKEIGARGLGFLDDGTSPRSLGVALASKLKTPSAQASIVIDAVPRPEAIDRELARLEAEARKSGVVLASASALPMTIDRIARWAGDLEARGVRLVPVSALLRTPAAATRLSSAAP